MLKQFDIFRNAKESRRASRENQITDPGVINEFSGKKSIVNTFNCDGKRFIQCRRGNNRIRSADFLFPGIIHKGYKLTGIVFDGMSFAESESFKIKSRSE